MKIGVLSDLHMEFRNDGFVFDEDIARQCDVIVIAGDLHPNEKYRNLFIDNLSDRYQTTVLFVEGNHDFYGSKWSEFKGLITEVDGVRFALSTHWTQISHTDPRYLLNDFNMIDDISVEKWNDYNRKSREFLMASRADVIVTHHAPSHLSIVDRFKGDAANPFFADNVDVTQYPAKLWIHGHMHDRIDYTVEGVRVFCNPAGYPKEYRSQGLSKPRNIEIIEI